MKALGVYYDYGGLTKLKEAGADVIISDQKKLAEIVSDLLPL